MFHFIFDTNFPFGNQLNTYAIYGALPEFRVVGRRVSGMGSTRKYFKGSWQQAKPFGVLGSREQRTQGTEDTYFRELGRKVIFISVNRQLRPPHPVVGPHNIVILHHIYNHFRGVDAFASMLLIVPMRYFCCGSYCFVFWSRIFVLFGPLCVFIFF